MPDDERTINELIEASSLGTPEAKALRERTPPEVVDRIMAEVDRRHGCPTCGHAVKVVGKTTQHYEPTGCLQLEDDHELCEQEASALRAVIERVMTQHWDLAACTCWVCEEGQAAGARPRDRYLNHKGDPRPRVTVEQPPRP